MTVLTNRQTAWPEMPYRDSLRPSLGVAGKNVESRVKPAVAMWQISPCLDCNPAFLMHPIVLKHSTLLFPILPNHLHNISFWKIWGGIL